MTLLEDRNTLLRGRDIVPMEGNNFWGYGHSIVAGTGASQPERCYISRLASQTLSPIWRNFGISGQTIGQTASVLTGGATGQSAKVWTPNQSGLVALNAVVNSVINTTNANDAQEKVGFQTGLKAALRILRSSSWVANTDASCVYTGAWSTPSPVNISGPNCHATGTNGDKVTITTTATEIALMLIGFPGATNSNFSITVNGGAFTPETSTTNSQTTPAETYSIMSVRIPNLSGTSTIVLTNTSAATLYFDGYLIKSATPPGIIVMKDAIPTSAGLILNGTGANKTVANLQTFFGYVDSICLSAEFNDGTVQIADPNPYWDPAMFISDGVHPNNWGHSIYAYAFKKAAERLKMNTGLSRGS